jgi:Uncharacterised protein family (UPF0236)
MPDRTTAAQTPETFVRTLTEQMATLARTLSDWVQAEVRPLQEIEEQVVRVLHDLGQTVLAGLCHLAAPKRPEPAVACPCGATSGYVRMRPATVTTVLGPIHITRAYYHCTACRQGQAPLDAQLQIAAGGLSAGLNELLALLGATQDSFAQATEILARLCLVDVCPNSARAASEELGALLHAQAEAVIAQAERSHSSPAAGTPAPPRLYLSMDGVLAHLHDAGWKEIKTGCVYSTRTRVPRKRPDRVEIHAEAQSYVAAMATAERFGWQLWAEACRRGMTERSEVVVLGDGAHWIWNIASAHFPSATQILDWYHASEYVWNAATAIYGESSALRTSWAQQQLDCLWEGQVAQVRGVLEGYRGKGEAVTAAISYYRTHQARMDYPSYRARGLQIGSGTIESTCKQLVSARLKLAGMIWDADGAEAVAVVRAWLKSDRWAEAMRLRPPPQRTYRRQPVPPQAALAAA